MRDWVWNWGWYSNKTRGLRAKSRGDGREATGELTIDIDDSCPPGRAARRRRWAQLIQRVLEVDPLTCARCGGRMKVIGFLEPYQPDVIGRILRHLGLDPQPRPPPEVGRLVDLDVEAVETCARHASEYVEDCDPGL